MGDFSLLQLTNKIHQQIDSQEILDVQLRQAYALARVANIADFDQLSPSVIRDYLWTMTDRLQQGLQASERLSAELWNLSKMLIKADSSAIDAKEN